ncbi:uncharacterized protein N7482_005024 [Penicillium canariense]|uniref:Uncharacterized protein n=1 Tax=Penicillium canariense TaxID=189055 RepID=A0A9W9I408_9EURO|nr:uncharacterized protein N7482_005024 [Penicillium canariense]KAJ5166243.1 hypothetical protein N7482_005024 [Penicillium canariense]
MRSSYDRTDEPSYGSYQLSGKPRSQKGNRPYQPDPYCYCQGEVISLPTRKDDSSEKSILGHSAGIKQTQEVLVTYERNLDEERSLEDRVEVFRAGRRS